MDYSNVTYLSLEGHVELEKYRYLYFFLVLTVYLMIICFNGLVIFVIFINKCLHEPMYVFIAALLCNALYGSTALCPKLLTDFLSESQTVSYEACLFQSFFLYTYAMSEFTLLSAMAYDRYVSICKPLQYATIINMSTVRKLLFCCWCVPCFENSIALTLTFQVKLCRNKLNRIYCNNSSVVKLGCGDISIRNSYAFFIFAIAVIPPVIFVIYSYIRILHVCLQSSNDFRRKALQTCFPHLLIFISYTVTSCFEVINNRLESRDIPQIITMIMSVENIIIPPLFNPIIYGVKMQKIYDGIKKLICKQM